MLPQLLVQVAKGRRLRSTTARLIRPILHLLAQAYGAALSAVKLVHKHKRRTLPVPTICVGNLTCGGTGKTPMASHIASLLHAEAGLVPLVLTRVRYIVALPFFKLPLLQGYGSDECTQLAHDLPNSYVGVGADRHAVAAAVIMRRI